jgi:mono/diheme cytochrome c family protein
MRQSSFQSILLVSAVAVLIAWTAQAIRPQSAQAIPMFAKRTGASCELCHTVFPGMSNYGMMVMMSDFNMLPYHSATDVGFTSFVLEEEFLSNPDGSPPPPKLHTENLGILNGGFIGPHFTYYLEQHIVDGGFIGGTDQLWLSYNELFGGSGSIQFGKFHTPFPFMPAHRITIARYATTSATIGGNGFNEDDSHWGVTLAQMQGTLMYSASVLGGNDLIGPGAFALGGNHDHSVDFSLMTMSDSPFNFGGGLISGFAPPAQPGATFDRFSRSAVYLQYVPPGNRHLGFQALGQLGSDSNPFGTGLGTHTRGGFVEAQYDLGRRNWGILRWDTQNGDSPIAGATLDYIHQMTRNSKVTIEGRRLTTGTQFGVALEWAGPWSRGHVLAQPLLGSMPGMNMSGMSMAPAPMSPVETLLANGNADRGHAMFESHNCAACHGAAGTGGGIGPRLIGVGASTQPSQLYDYVKHPRRPMPDFKLSDQEIADLIAYVVALTPGHTVADDIAKAHGASMSMNGMSMKGMSMGGMQMGAAPPTYPEDQEPLYGGTQGYFSGIETGDAAAGRSIYERSCAQCHGASAEGARGPRLDGLAARFTPSHIGWHILQHKTTSVHLHLSNAEIADLTAFLETIPGRVPVRSTQLDTSRNNQ